MFEILRICPLSFALDAAQVQLRVRMEFTTPQSCLIVNLNRYMLDNAALGTEEYEFKA